MRKKVFLFLILSFVCLVSGTAYYWKGYRDVDYAFSFLYYDVQTIKFINSMGIYLTNYEPPVDVSLEGKTIELIDLYILGLKEIFIAYVFMIASVVFALIALILIFREVVIK
jgi:hypothetical protein